MLGEKKLRKTTILLDNHSSVTFEAQSRICECGEHVFSEEDFEAYWGAFDKACQEQKA